MKLYYTKGACSLAVRIIINELNLPCEFEAVNLKTKRTEDNKDFLAINPKGSIPVLEVSHNKVLTENAVILQYLADTYNAFELCPAIGDFQRYRVLEWVNFITSELHKTIGAMFNPAVTDDMKQKIYLPIVYQKFKFINAHLKEQDYLIGNQFTLPDAYLFVVLNWASFFKIDMKEYSLLINYFEKLKQRPSIVKSLEQEE